MRSAVALADIHEVGHLAVHLYMNSLSISHLVSNVAFQEEDIFTVASGLPLDPQGDDKCLHTLNSVEESIARKLRGCRGAPSKKKSAEGDMTTGKPAQHALLSSS